MFEREQAKTGTVKKASFYSTCTKECKRRAICSCSQRMIFDMALKTTSADTNWKAAKPSNTVVALMMPRRQYGPQSRRFIESIVNAWKIGTEITDYSLQLGSVISLQTKFKAGEKWSKRKKITFLRAFFRAQSNVLTHGVFVGLDITLKRLAERAWSYLCECRGKAVLWGEFRPRRGQGCGQEGTGQSEPLIDIAFSREIAHSSKQIWGFSNQNEPLPNRNELPTGETTDSLRCLE